jgi:hypothetical protein
VNWQDYEIEVAQFLETLGFDVERGAQIDGARGTHHVDVRASIRLYGLDLLWVAECKLWSTKVKKAHALTFKGVVDDVGAHLGLLLSEVGFQPGATDVLEKTNVLALSLGELRARAYPELLAKRLDAVTSWQAAVSEQLSLIQQAMSDQLQAIESDANVAQEYRALLAEYESNYPDLGSLAMSDMALKRARVDDFPILFEGNDHQPIVFVDVGSLLGAVESTLKRSEARTAALLDQFAFLRDAVLSRS